MSSQAKWKLLAVLIVVSAILGAVGWQQFAPRPMWPTTIMITPTVTTVTSSQTIVAAQRQTEWIRAGEVKPVNYYLTLLESNDTQPYVQLASDLRRLPDLTNATAVAKITFLALNATNPEVKEAFELIIKGGTPNSRDFRYPVPSWNTELQVLYWLASQSRFKKDDTLALSIAMVNGFWVTIGDEQVRAAVSKDTNDLLSFLRETNEIQKERGYSQLEDYPLEAKICLTWTGGDPNRAGHSYENDPRWSLHIHALGNFIPKPADIKGYNWNTVSVETLRKARQLIDEKGWIDRSVDRTVRNMEEYIYTSNRPHWIFTWPNPPIIEVDGQKAICRNMNNMDFEFEHLLKNGSGIGVCGDEAVLIEALCKSWGISTTQVKRTWEGPESNHQHCIYFEPSSKLWKAYEKQVATYDSRERGQGVQNVYIFRPPVADPNYFKSEIDSNQSLKMRNLYYRMLSISTDNIVKMFTTGVKTSQMKQWLLYS